MQPALVGQLSIQVNNAMRDLLSVFHTRLSISLHSSLAKKLSTMALWCASPNVPIEVRMFISSQRLPKATLVY